MAACRREAVQKDIKELETTIARQRDAMARMNGKLADIKATKEALEEDIFNLQGKLDQAAKVSRTLLAPALTGKACCSGNSLVLSVQTGSRHSTYVLGHIYKAFLEALLQADEKSGTLRTISSSDEAKRQSACLAGWGS